MIHLEPETSTTRTPSPAARESRTLLRAAGLRKAFGGQTVLDGIDLELREGEVVLLRGENGSGKTTLLNILTGNLEPDAGRIEYRADGSPRTYSFPRRWWQELNPFDHFTPEFVAREGIGRTWQDVRLFGSLSLRDNIAVAEPGHSGENPLVALLAPGRAYRRESELDTRAASMLARLGLAGRESSSADMVSLGQSKRVAIARAVAAGARILFLDEPLAGLDRQGISDVLSLLESLVREENLTLVIVEHIFNQPHLHGLVTTDWLLENGRLHRHGGHAKPATRHAPPATRPERPEWFHLLAGDDAEIIDEPLPRGALLTRIRRPDRWKPQAKPVLEIQNLLVQRGPRTVIGLDELGNPVGFDLTLHKGEIAILQAPNGWGKSTLFDAVCGLIPSISGGVAQGGATLQKAIGKGKFRAVPSQGSVFAYLLINEQFSLSRKPQAQKTVSKFPSHRKASSLSGGERQILSLALASPSSILLADEPFAALDRHYTDHAVELLLQSSSLLVLIPSVSKSPLDQI